jgi:hypothetical protein
MSVHPGTALYEGEFPMNRLISQVRRPVKRQHADDYLLITLLSFAASVSGTRLFLELADYPQLGGGGLHIAHVLWGGLLLFVASLLPLILANRWVYPLGAALAGAGVGLFIDEVGKFITSNNDYFYPAAAPIIYAFFLLVVLVYTRIRHTPPPDPRIELYHALDVLEEVLDHDLDDNERKDLLNRLEKVAVQHDHPEFAQLALALGNYLKRQDIHLSVELPNFWKRQYQRLLVFETRFVKEKRLRALLIGGLSGLGLFAVFHGMQFLIARFTPEVQLSSIATTYWFLGRVLIELIVSLMILASVFLLLFGQVNRGLSYAYYSLILSLSAVNLLVFYFNQFSTIVPAMIQFTLLLLVIYYRRHFLPTGDNT